MAAGAYYPQRNGDHVYDVTVTTDEMQRPSRRYRAHLSCAAECIENGQLALIQVDLRDTYGPTITEALQALDDSFDKWRLQHMAKSQ
jgi:hypothetical protein